jgi:hypothetical protein
MMPLESLISPDDPSAAVIPGYGPLPTSWPGKSSPPVRDANGGAGYSPHLQQRQTDAGPLSAVTPTDAVSTAGWPNSSSCVIKPVVIRSVMRRSATLTTSPATVTADPPRWRMAAAHALAATSYAKCPVGASNSSIAASTADRTRSSSPHPPATTTSAEHPTRCNYGAAGPGAARTTRSPAAAAFSGVPARACGPSSDTGHRIDQPVINTRIHRSERGRPWDATPS